MSPFRAFEPFRRSWIVPHWYRVSLSVSRVLRRVIFIFIRVSRRGRGRRGLRPRGRAHNRRATGESDSTPRRGTAGASTLHRAARRARRTVRGAECANARRAPTRRAARRLRPRTNEQAGRGPVTRKPDRKQAPKAGTERLGARPPALRLPGLPCRYATDKLRIEDRGG